MKKIFVYEGQETNYEVSSEGKVFNRKTGKELKGTYGRNEYHSVQLTIQGKIKTFMVHRLVASMFCDNPNNYTMVSHINEDKLDNRAENLCWVETAANQKSSSQKSNDPNKANLKENNWKPLDINDKYLISDDGQLASRTTLTLFKGSLRNGYKRFSIGGKMYSAHILVYTNFVGEIPEKCVIDHIDGNKLNNSVSNLRAVTQSQNAKNGFNNGRKGQVKVTFYSDSGEELNNFDSIQSAADFLNATYASINSASRYGTKAKGIYVYRSNCINTPEEFNTPMPDEAEPYNGMNKTYIYDGKLYSRTSRHLIPLFKDEDGAYAYLSAANGKYVKTYMNP